MTPRELLTIGARELGIELSLEGVNSICVYLAELKKWNRKINLTAIRDDRDAVIKHVLDSLAYTGGFQAVPGLTLLDMGSGAGLPGIPIKLVQPGLTITLVESVKKKSSFLRHVVRTLQLTGIEVVDKRTEELPAPYLAAYDVVTARAFAGMPQALAAGVPFLKAGGRMVLSRGPEETISEEDIARAGVVREQTIELTLPHSDYKRAIWVFKKAG
jgi:16S rRNA (guanine527-N7)-methyltransferase